MLQGYKDIFALLIMIFFSFLCAVYAQPASHAGIIVLFFIVFAKIMLIAQLLFSCGLKLCFLRETEVDQYLPYLVTSKREHFDEIKVILYTKLEIENLILPALF